MLSGTDISRTMEGLDAFSFFPESSWRAAGLVALLTLSCCDGD